MLQPPSFVLALALVNSIHHGLRNTKRNLSTFFGAQIAPPQHARLIPESSQDCAGARVPLFSDLGAGVVPLGRRRGRRLFFDHSIHFFPHLPPSVPLPNPYKCECVID